MVSPANTAVGLTKAGGEPGEPQKFNKVCKNDRVAIRDAVLGTKNYQGILGTWSFDANGDTSLTAMSGNTVKNSKWEFITVLDAKAK